MTAVDLFHLLLKDQSRAAQANQYRSLNIHSSWTRNSLRFIGTENHRALFVNYQPQELTIRYLVNAVTKDLITWTPMSAGNEPAVIRAGDEEFPSSEATERLSQLVMEWLGPGRARAILPET